MCDLKESLSICRVLIGFAVSAIGGLVIGPIVNRMWHFISDKQGKDKDGNEIKLPSEFLKPRGALSVPLGAVERTLYTAAIIVCATQVIGLWFVLKVAAKWKNLTNYRGADNIWLIGNALSLLFGFIGAWIALGHIPSFH